MSEPDLETCKHGTPMKTPCSTCDEAYGPVDAPDAVKLKYTDRHCIKLEAQLAEARAVLREAEWADGSAGFATCPVCDRFRPGQDVPAGLDQRIGHAPPCRLNKVLEGT